MTTPKHKYIRTEAPELLTEPLTVNVDGMALKVFNRYRQARHAWLSSTGDIEEKNRLRAAVEDAADEVASFVNAAVNRDLGEPDDRAVVES